MLMMPWKFFILPTIQILVIAGFLLGGWFTFLGLVVFLTMSLGFDFVEDRSGVDEMTDLGTPGRVLVYVICALQFALIAVGISVAMNSDTWVQTIGVAMTFGPILAVGCGNPGHELAHSKHWYDHEIARALFAVCLHPSVLIDHVYRHHVTVGTPGDPLTARRGERFGAYMMRSVPAQHSGPWQFERERLARKGPVALVMAQPRDPGLCDVCRLPDAGHRALRSDRPAGRRSSRTLRDTRHGGVQLHGPLRRDAGSRHPVRVSPFLEHAVHDQFGIYLEPDQPFPSPHGPKPALLGLEC